MSRVQFFYIDHSAHTQVVIVYQYIQAVKQVNWCPQKIRSDRGNEVVMAADTHYALYCQSLNRTEADLQAAPPLLLDCYLFGCSTQNQRIKAIWNQMIRSVTRPWLVRCYYYAI